MTYAANEESRHSGQPVELLKFLVTGEPTAILEQSVDFGDYADTAAMLAAWTVDDPEAMAIVDLSTAHYETSSGKSMRVRFTGLTPSDHPYRVQVSLLVTGLTPGETYTFSADYYSLGPDGGGPIGSWNPITPSLDNISSTVVADGSGEATVYVAPSIVSGSPTVTYFFDNMQLFHATTEVAHGYTLDGLSHTFRGGTYTPAIFSHTPFEYGGGEVVNGEIELTVPRDHFIAKLVRGGTPVAPVAVTIYLVHRPDIAAGTSYRTPFIGQVTNSKVKGTDCVLTLATARSLLDRKRPSVRCQKPCNWMLYDERCQLNKADFAYTSGTITAINGKVVTISGLADEAGSDFTKFQFGFLVNQAGESCFIEAQDSRSGNDDVTLLAVPSTLEVGQTVTVHWGCDRTTGATGCGRFNNIVHFGGFPKMAPRNLYVGAGIQP